MHTPCKTFSSSFLIAVFAAGGRRPRVRLRRAGRPQVSGLYLLCALIAVGLFVYLLVALFNAENL